MLTGRRWMQAAAAALLVFGVLSAHADGPHIALHAVSGPYEVTVFTAPDPLVAGPVELTALVQTVRTGVLAAPVRIEGELTLLKPPGGRQPITLTPAASSNSQLPGATVRLTAAGVYRLQLRVQAPGLPLEMVQGELPVGRNEGRRDTILWSVLLAAAAVALFLANQTAKQRLRAPRTTAR